MTIDPLQSKTAGSTGDSTRESTIDSSINGSVDSSGQGSPLTAFVTYFADTQTNVPPGVRAVEPPADTRQAIRGNLYAVVELFQDQVASDSAPSMDQIFPQSANLQEEILAAIQRTYYTGKGTQTKVLTEALEAAHQILVGHNSRHADAPLRAGLLCMAFLQDQLSIATSGSALALVVTDKRIEQFPFTLERPEERPAPGLEPNIEVLRREVHEGAAFFIGGGSWLEQVSLRTLVSVVAHADIDHRFDAMNELRQLAQEGRQERSSNSREGHPPALLIVLGGASEQGSVSASPYSQSALSRPSPSGDAFSQTPLPTAIPNDLPTAVNASPPLSEVRRVADDTPRTMPDAIAAPISSAYNRGDSGAVPFRTDNSFEQIPNISSEDELGANFGFDEPHGGTQPSTAPRNRKGGGLIESTIAGVTRVKDFWVDIFTNQEEDEPKAKSRARSPQPFKMPLPARGDRARLFILTAVLIVFLVPVIVTVMYLQNGADVRRQAEVLVEQAKIGITEAQRALDEGEKGIARTKLNEAKSDLDQAFERVGYTPEITQLLTDVQIELQDVLQVKPLYGLVDPLVRFPPDALPHRLIVVDQDIYVLDNGRQMILRYQLDEERSYVNDESGEIVLKEGSEIDGVRVGPLVDIAWQDPVPGFEDKAHLIVLDRNNQIFRYNEQVEGVTRLVFGEQENWQYPTQIQTYLGRIYITDEGLGEIYRYDPGNYGDVPLLWLDEQTHVNLAGLSSMRIDGDIWMLFNNGMILRYHQRVQVPYSLDSSVNIVENPVDMFVDSQSSSFIYLADASQERILVYDKNGTYQYQFRAPESGPLRALRGLFVDEVAGEMYILTETSLFQHPLPR